MNLRYISQTPWKLLNEIHRWVSLPFVKFLFSLNSIPWGKNWRFYGVPIIQKHRQSFMHLGSNIQLRSSTRSNPLGPYHPVIFCTWQAGAILEIGDNFGMTGGTICAAERIIIGNYVVVGSNSTIIDTDFHPSVSENRRLYPDQAKTAPIVIEDDVFIGMNSIILKGVTIGRGSMIGAGSVVTHDVPPKSIVAGNPARVITNI